MPRLSDRDARRGEILAALLRIAGERGLHAVSMRTVAAQAGVSVSTVQYYFRTKEELLFAGLRHQADIVGRRAVAGMPVDPAEHPRDSLRAWLVQFVPVDAEQRAAYIVFAAYHALALTDPALAELSYSRDSVELERALCELVAAAQRSGAVPAERDADAEAGNLLALATGLADSVMAGMRSPETAIALLDYQLDHVFRTPSAGSVG
ncbi:TetR/AcrR family transcriptional regulator [Verrucosispora sp. NA02020]|uniref:TetR/AcrR family transcriptional regulator n=1 Tax=Verrucosispora sp. NA02020 TaxID=2742132 RepID=UPI0015919E6A|nr:TetR/AcrR family transcriptional regulator [Verrucosispora sp. NA02020]QKW12602.1 TetR/AcrR family transcriptional regulator [Verrucosispora sp. NA02020]